MCWRVSTCRFRAAMWPTPWMRPSKARRSSAARYGWSRRRSTPAGAARPAAVKLVRSVAEVREAAEGLLGSTLVTHQTGAEGQTVKRIYVEEGCDIARELYFSMLVDRTGGRVTVVASTDGRHEYRGGGRGGAGRRSRPFRSTRRPVCSRITAAALHPRSGSERPRPEGPRGCLPISTGHSRSSTPA